MLALARHYPLMPTEHLAWDAALHARLDRLRIPVHDSLSAITGPATAALRRYGFAILRGLSPTESRETSTSRLIELALMLGRIVPQSLRGELVEDIRDFSDVDEHDDRGYRSRGELIPHSDPPTLIVLHCLRAAKHGGQTSLVNVRAIHNRLAHEQPDLLQELYRGFHFWQVEGSYGIAHARPSAEARSIFAQRNGIISCVIYRPFIHRAMQALGREMDRRQVAALDAFESCASAPELALRFYLQPGETLLLHNRTVLHARTDYEDGPEPERRRHLLRVWIDAPELLPVSPQHELGDLFAAA